MKTTAAIVLYLLFLEAPITFENISPVDAESGTIYIRADGRIDPPTATLVSGDNLTYTLTANTTNGIVIERNGTILNGAGYALKGSSSSNGITLIGVRNVTITNMQLTGFFVGIHLNSSSNNYLHGNRITHTVWSRGAGGIQLEQASCNNSIVHNEVSHNWGGIWLRDASNDNHIGENNVTANEDYGINLWESSNNNISNNTIEFTNDSGILLAFASNNNTVSGNNVEENVIGIEVRNSSYNVVFHNNFVNNRVHQAYDLAWDSPAFAPSVNTWDRGNRLGGNYWSDYAERYPTAQERDASGMWDTPYVIDENNQDNYPLIPEFPPFILLPLFLIATLLAVRVYPKKAGTGDP